MEVRNCERCNKIFRPISGRRYCPECIETDRKDYDTVRKFLRDNPKATMVEIAKETGVSAKKIREYIREGRLVLVGQEITCEQCNKPIDKGRFCPECALEFEKGFRSGHRPPPEKRSAPRRDGDDPSYSWNRFRRW